MNVKDSGCVYIVMLNWNGWADTIECLESVFKNRYCSYRVVVCDNDSADGSLEKIKLWAGGKLVSQQQNDKLARYSQPPVEKPVPFMEYDRTAAEAGGAADDQSQLILIQTGGNLGFAGGNNVGMRYALKQNDCKYAWLLNNDTVIDPDALASLVSRMERSDNVGICGSTLIYYHSPEFIQVLGGAQYNKWRCRARQMGNGKKYETDAGYDAAEKQLDYIAGASMLVSRAFLEEIGLMQEDYFLYYEEIDWARRSCGKFKLGYAPDSIVFHKEGGSIGTGEIGKRSSLAIYYLQKNRVKFVRRFHPLFLPVLFANILYETCKSLFKKDFFEVKWSLCGCMGRPLKSVSSTKRL